MPESVVDPRSSRRERKKREARRRIYDAAFALFVEQGYDATTVDQIAERADVAKGTVFNYFPRKMSFLAALAEHWTISLLEELGPVESWVGTTREKLTRVFVFLADLGARNPELARLAFFESLRYMHAVVADKRAAEEPVRRLQAMTRFVLEQGRAAGEIRGDVDVEGAAALIEMAFHRTLADWLSVGGSRAGLHRELTAKFDIVFNGIARPAAATLRRRGKGTGA
jgi:TetR/AcrR family transcriptional regulator, cholesterol catabolism regulator